MSRGWSYNAGDWNATCDSCGRKFKASQLRKRWDGLMVCEEDWNPRHSLDFVRSHADHQTPPWIRPRPADVFVPINWTERPVDQTFLSESVSTVADFYRYIGQILYPTDVDVVNGNQINLLPINYSSVDDPPPTNTEMYNLGESVVTAIGFNVSLSDSTTLSETVSTTEGEYPSDSFSISEAVFAYTITNKLLNAHLINEVTLG